MATVEHVRVPVEHRLLGMDKRTFPYALFVVAVFLIATVVIPRIDDAITWDDPIQAGDTLALTTDITLTPSVGWNLEDGQRAGAEAGPGANVVLVHDAVTFAVAADSFDGTPTELLDQIAKVTSSTGDPSFAVSGDPGTVTTTSGEVGVVQGYSSVNGDGIIAAFVIDGTGLKITAYGPPAQMTAAAPDLHDMIVSITAGTDGSAS
jgi:hypothetical protein